jgi:gas vesicle protein
MMIKARSAVNVMTGFLSGGLVATAVTLLVAPQSGERTRRQIKKNYLKTMRKAEMALEDARSQVLEAVEDTQSKVEELLDEIGQEAKRRTARLTEIAHR